jgi:hypothetical protein
VQTIVTTFGDGATSTATNNATGNSVSWASDHVTKTTTYVFSNGGSNAVVSTVSPTYTNPTLTAANYPGNWTSVGTVTAPSVSSNTVTYGDGYSFVQDGTSAHPFWQSVLRNNSISDPNAVVYSTTVPYDLRWGTPDKNGPAYSAIFSDGAAPYLTFPMNLNVYGQFVSGPCVAEIPLASFCALPKVATPAAEVLAAWRDGWTGQGKNILMIDGIYTQHGVTTTILANRYAIAATVYGLDFGTLSSIKMFDGSNPSTGATIHVINASVGTNLWTLGHSKPFSDAEIAQRASEMAIKNNNLASVINGQVTYNGFSLIDATVVKAAGNDGVDTKYESTTAKLASDSNIYSRLLIVGATDYFGTTSSRTDIATYSNLAGTNTSIQSRYLVASGNTPYGDNYIAVDGKTLSSSIISSDGSYANVGTSYAAPRVAGYAAILRQKFPNLDGIKTASILLDTARYDTLTCYSATPTQFVSTSGCNPAIYGRGEASLSRSLAPVGNLR